MTRAEFMRALENGLSQLPDEEIDKQLSYYSELIDDMLEDGMSEQEATERLGSIDDIVQNILQETPLPLLIKKKINPSGSWTAMNILLLILGFPLWFPLLITAAALAFTFYAVIWVIIIVLFVCVLVIGLVSAALIISFIICLSRSVAAAFMILGTSIALAGLTVLAFLASVCVARLLIKATTAAARGIKSWFIRKD